MSDYTSTFTEVDGVDDVEAADFSTEFDAIATASATKLDKTGDTATNITFAGTITGFYRGALVYKSTDETITKNVYTHLSFNQEDHDTSSIHDNATNNQRLTVPSGVTKVRLHGQVMWDGIIDDTITRVYVSKNDETTTPTGAVGLPAIIPPTKDHASNGSLCTFTTPVVSVTATDYFTLCVFYTAISGAATMDVLADNGIGHKTYFAMEIIEG